eukprot:CAMPEP_0194560356 /NCGR_PEP_ID=MMETSP0292-20121207/1562_1 /TAXON_ID=39354 /ORGANISM="Heterosigma akashiwo, Strain CCMP2393" /LENGTH=41 /DNA_ID= /DNA_START= /DNA_END= /DNA_ORIENTATION=
MPWPQAAFGAWQECTWPGAASALPASTGPRTGAAAFAGGGL